MKRDMPRYITDLKGTLYFRRRGWDTVRIKSAFGTPEFWAEYAMIQKGTAPAPKGMTFTALIGSYRRSERYTGLKPRTRRDYDGILANIEARLGSARPDGLARKHVIALRDSNAETVRFANYVVQVIRILMEHAIDIGMVKENPAKGVKLLKSKAEPRKPWPADTVNEFRSAYEYDARERLLFELLIGTGQRIGDVLRMQWGHIDGDGINVTQGKTGKPLWVPFTPHLRAALAAAPRRNLTILTRFDGRKAWAYRGAADAMMTARRTIGAEAYDIHSLRHTAASELALAGCTDELIAAVTGQSMAMVARYTATARQKVRAIKAQGKRE
jgi:integrase